MENFFTAIEPFFRILRFLGLFPMNFKAPINTGNIAFSALSGLNTIVSFLILLLAIIATFINHMIFASEKQTFLDYLVWSCFLVITIPIITVQFMIQVVNAKKIKKLVKLMNQIDIKFESLSIKLNYKEQRKWIRNFVILLFIISIP